MDGFKADFVQYLKENNLLERVDLNKNDANINVQKYDDELTDFLKDYKIDENELIEASIDVNEILTMDFNDIANVNVKDDEIGTGKDVIGGFFNFLINQNDIKAQVDKNNDGKFSKDEIAEFAKTVASKDGDDSSFTLKDMLGSYQQMNDKTFKIGDFSAINNNLINYVVPDVQQDKTPPKTTVDTEIRPQNVATITQESLKGDDETQLREKQEKQAGIAEQSNQNAQAALNGTIGAVQPPNSAVDSAYSAYMTQVQKVSNDENKFAQQLSEKNTQITNKQNELHNWQIQAESEKQDCMRLDVEVKDAQSAYDSVQQALSSAQSALNSLAKPGEKATPNEKSAYQAKYSSLQSALSQAQQEADKAKEELEKKQKDYEDATDKYNNTLEQVNETQSELETLNKELTTLQAEIAKANAENKTQLETLANSWNNTKAQNEASRQQNFENFSQTAQTAISNLAVINEAIDNLP